MIWNWSELTSEKAVPCHGNGGPSFLVGSPWRLGATRCVREVMPKGAVMHGAPRWLEFAMFGGIKDCEYMVHPKSLTWFTWKWWFPSLESPFLLEYVHFCRWSILNFRGSFLHILRDFPFFLQLMVQKSPVDMVNTPPKFNMEPENDGFQ